MSLLLFYYSFSMHLIFSLFFLLQGVAFSKRHAFITAALLIAANFSCLFLDRFQTIALVIAFYIVAFIQKKSVLLSVFSFTLSWVTIGSIWVLFFDIPYYIFGIDFASWSLPMTIVYLLIELTCLTLLFHFIRKQYKKYDYMTIPWFTNKIYTLLSAFYLFIFILLYFFTHVIHENFITLYVYSVLVMLLYMCLGLTIFLLFLYIEWQKQQIAIHTKQLQEEQLIFESNHEFSHDFKGMMLVASSYLRKKDYQAALEYLDEITNYYNEEIGQNEYDEINNLSIPALQGILLAKVNQSKQEQIPFQIHIPTKVTMLPIPTIDMIRVLQIFLDNAFEAASFAEKPTVLFRCFMEEEQIHISIKNNRDAGESSSLVKWMERKYTSKAGHKGLGLTIANKIVARYENLDTAFRLEETTFTADIYLQLLKK